MRRNDLALANFICTFGDDKVLLDFAHDIVIPTFFTETLVRTYGDTSYYIYDPKWQLLAHNGEEELAITGRFVKDTILKRQQIIDNGRLKEDYDELESAPSAYFTLILSDHRLLYFAETQFAPELSAFASTLQIFMRRVWRQFLADEHARRAGSITHKMLRQEYPMPRLSIVPVARTDTIAELLRSFRVIDRIKFRLIRPNDETDASAVLQSVRERFQPLSPERVDLEIADAKGLDNEESISAVSEAAGGLNTDIIVTGTDDYGNKAKVDNQEFALKIPIGDPPDDDNGLAHRLFSEFIAQVKNGSVHRGHITDQAKALIDALKKLVL